MNQTFINLYNYLKSLNFLINKYYTQKIMCSFIFSLKKLKNKLLLVILYFKSFYFIQSKKSLQFNNLKLFKFIHLFLLHILHLIHHHHLQL